MKISTIVSNLHVTKSFKDGRFKFIEKYVYFFEFRPTEQEVVELFYFIDFREIALDGKVYMVGNKKGLYIDKRPIPLVNYASGKSKICFKQKENGNKSKKDYEYLFKNKTDSVFPYISIHLASECNSLLYSDKPKLSDLVFYIFMPKTGRVDVFYHLQSLPEQNRVIFEKLATNAMKSKLFTY